MTPNRSFHYFAIVLFSLAACAKPEVAKVSTPTDSNTGRNTGNNTGEASNVATPIPSPIPSPGPTTHLWLTRDASQSVTNAQSGTQIMFDHTILDTLREYNPTTGVFAPATAGAYQINAIIGLIGPWNNGDFCEVLVSTAKKGIIAANRSAISASQGPCTVDVSTIAFLEAGEQLAIGSVAGTSAAKNTVARTVNPMNALMIARIGN